MLQVETIGDVYVIAGGLPVRIGDRHILEVANCALDLMNATYQLKVATESDAANWSVKLRMGRKCF